MWVYVTPPAAHHLCNNSSCDCLQVFILHSSVGQGTSTTVGATHEKLSGQDKKESKFWLDPEEYSLRKRLPPSLPRRNCDIYVTNKTHFKVQLDRYFILIGSEVGNTPCKSHQSIFFSFV